MLRAAAAAAAAQPQLQVCVVCVQSSANLSPTPLYTPHPAVIPRFAAQQFNLSFVRNLRNASPAKAWAWKTLRVCVSVFHCVLIHTTDNLCCRSHLPCPRSTSFAAPALSILHTACVANILEIRVLLSVQVSLYCRLFLSLSLSLSFSVYTRNLSEV